MTGGYQEFLARKAQADSASGFEPTWLPGFLFGFQKDLTAWAIRQGRAALFEDCGLGKSPQELVWAQNVHRHTGKPVLILTPLAVTFQMQAEAVKFGVDAAISRDGALPAPVVITNYERLEKFDRNRLGGVVCDESSAIKAFDGVRRALVTDFLRKMPYRLLGTATAAPNDYVELGTSSEALGYLGHVDMLTRFFVNDQRTIDVKGHYKGFAAPRQWGKQQWRFKGHAGEPFWRWVTSWARAARRPSDLGYDDDGFILPPLEYRQHIVKAAAPVLDGTLFEVPAVGLHEERAELRRTITERCEQAAELLDGAKTGIAWCHLNPEGDLLTRLIPGAVQVAGSDSTDAKEDKLAAFTRGDIRVLVTKPKIGAWGLNWQHCHRMTYFPDYSYEAHYQAVRRCWRFGQAEPVTVDIITTPGGANALAGLRRKAEQADEMFTALTAYMNDALGVRRSAVYDQDPEVPAVGKILTSDVTDRWAVYNGDAIEVMEDLPDGFTHGVIYSPPFAYGDEGLAGGGLYKYSSSERDLSNAGGYSEFFEQYEFFVRELHRLTMPGRVNAVHCMDTPTGNSGGDALTDFPGDLIRLHQECGFDYCGRHVIWKEPLAVRNRTMVKDLTHKTVVDDATFAGLAGADYLLIFRKKGKNPVPVTHPAGFTAYYGASHPPADVLSYRGFEGSQLENRYSHWVWQQYASAVWDDIRGNLGRWDNRDHDAVLPYREARDEEDEKHVHPLQLDVIYRFTEMRTNPGERVFTPFMGVGSEVYGAVKLGRLGVGAELKPSYYRQAVKNLATVARDAVATEALF